MKANRVTQALEILKRWDADESFDPHSDGGPSYAVTKKELAKVIALLESEAGPSLISHEIDRPAMMKILNNQARRIDKALPKGWGFALFLFSFGTNGELFYISNAVKSDVLNVLGEYLVRRGN